MATTIEKIQTLLSKIGKQKSHKVNFYAESTLDDGRVIATEDEAIDIGSIIKVIDEDGVAYELEEGDYVLSDGTPLSIGEGGMVAIMGGGDDQPAGVKDRKRVDDDRKRIADEKAKEKEKAKDGERPRIPGKDAEKAPPAEKKKGEPSKFEEIEKEVYSQFDEIEDEDRAKEIVEFIKEKLAEVEEIVEEKEEEEVMMSNEETEKVEFSSVVGNLMTRIDELETKLSDIENTPAEQGVTVNPTGDEYAFTKEPKEVFARVSKSDVLKMTTSERAKFMIQNKLTRI